MNMISVYVAGPMSGLPHYNFPEFNKTTDSLRMMGYEVFNPAEHEMPTYKENLEIDLSWICRFATHMYMLKGWEHSPGARAEHAVATALKLEIWYE